MKNYSYFFVIIFLAIISVQAEYCTTGKNGCECEWTNTISKNASLNQNLHSSTLSVYNETGTYCADPACHATMTLTFRWADDERAKTTERPPIGFEFKTVMNYFPTYPMQAIMKTDEFGRNYWKIVIDEAENPEDPLTGTSYAIEITYNQEYQSHGDVKCALSIAYKTFDVDAWEKGC